MICALALILLAGTPAQTGQHFPDVRGWRTVDEALAAEMPPPHASWLIRPGIVNVVTLTGPNSCAPCIRARGAIRRLAQLHADVQFSVLYEARPHELTEALKLDAYPDYVRVAYGPDIQKVLEKLDPPVQPVSWVIDGTGKIIHVETGWNGLESSFAVLLKTLEPQGTRGGLPGLIRSVRQELLKQALADEVLLAVPSDEQSRTALLSRAVPVLERDVRALDTAIGGLPPGELLRFAMHYHNALDRAKAGADVAFAPLPSALSPLGQDRLERRILLHAGLPGVRKLGLVTPVTLTLPGNRLQTVELVTSGQLVDADPKDVRIERLWHALATPDIRKTWITGWDLRLAWWHATHGEWPATDSYDPIRAGRIVEIGSLLQPRHIRGEAPISMEPGDLLLYSLPWQSDTSLFSIRSASNSSLEVSVDVDGVALVGADSGELTSYDFKLSVDPMSAPVRRPRPGLYWLRPRVPKGVDARRMLRPLPFPSRDFPWRDAPSFPTLPTSNDARGPEDVVRTFVDRAGAGCYFAGMPLDERLALTTFTSAPPATERLRLARGYTIVAPPEIKGESVTMSVVYQGALQWVDANGGRFGNADVADFDVTLQHTSDGWKISGKPFVPSVLLLDRSRWTPDLPRTEADDALRLGLTEKQYGRVAEMLATFEAAANASPKDPSPAFQAAMADALLSRPDESVRWLTAAADRGFQDPGQLDQEPDFASVRGSPGFVAVAARIRNVACDDLKRQRVESETDSKSLEDRISADMPELVKATNEYLHASETRKQELVPRLDDLRDSMSVLQERQKAAKARTDKIEAQINATCAGK